MLYGSVFQKCLVVSKEATCRAVPLFSEGQLKNVPDDKETEEVQSKLQPSPPIVGVQPNVKQSLSE